MKTKHWLGSLILSSSITAGSLVYTGSQFNELSHDWSNFNEACDDKILQHYETIKSYKLDLELAKYNLEKLTLSNVGDVSKYEPQLQQISTNLINILSDEEKLIATSEFKEASEHKSNMGRDVAYTFSGFVGGLVLSLLTGFFTYRSEKKYSEQIAIEQYKLDNPNGYDIS